MKWCWNCNREIVYEMYDKDLRRYQCGLCWGYRLLNGLTGETYLDTVSVHCDAGKRVPGFEVIIPPGRREDDIRHASEEELDALCETLDRYNRRGKYDKAGKLATPHTDAVWTEPPPAPAATGRVCPPDDADGRQRTWDVRFLRLAEHIASWSKDPSTKVGAVIVDGERRVVSMGYNGFARRVKDSPERYADRDLKIATVLHAEENAILFARRDLAGHTLYTWPFQPCAKCAGAVIQSGISRVVAPPLPDHLKERWLENTDRARRDFEDAGVLLEAITP